MCEVPVFYATTEGHTRRIAERVADQVRRHGLDSRALAIGSPEAALTDWGHLRGAAVAASIHLHKHQREAVAFADAHARELSSVPSLFVSVSLAAASKRARDVQAARRLAAEFAAQTGWRPSHVGAVAGCLAYTQYNWFVRWMMRRIAVREGASADTSRDHDYTDWVEVERLADALAYEVRVREIFPQGEPAFLRAG